VIPVGDAAEVESLGEGHRAAQAQAKQSIQAQAEAVLPVRQDRGWLRLAGLCRFGVWLGQTSDKRVIQISNAGKMGQCRGRTRRSAVC
jgi:hypothetical protein